MCSPWPSLLYEGVPRTDKCLWERRAIHTLLDVEDTPPETPGSTAEAGHDFPASTLPASTPRATSAGRKLLYQLQAPCPFLHLSQPADPFGARSPWASEPCARLRRHYITVHSAAALPLHQAHLTQLAPPHAHANGVNRSSPTCPSSTSPCGQNGNWS